jgi:hypothetical protein
LDRALVVIGSDPGCDLVLDHPTVSRRHLLVQVEASVKVTDLRSTAGTRINGAKLAPDLPCTLEPGDFLEVGKIAFSFHLAAPPASPPSPAPPSPRRAAPAPWKPVAAVVTVALLGGLLAFLSAGKEPPPAPAETPRPAPAPVAQAPPPVEEKPPPPPPEPEPPPKPKEPERAAPGELPPRAAAPDLPDLLEVDGSYYPARLRTLGGESVEALGADGRIYAVPMSRVKKIEDRADLAKRVRIERRRLAPKDVPARVALAEWCTARLLVDDAKALVREVLSHEPENKDARALKDRIEELG